MATVDYMKTYEILLKSINETPVKIYEGFSCRSLSEVRNIFRKIGRATYNAQITVNEITWAYNDTTKQVQSSTRTLTAEEIWGDE